MRSHLMARRGLSPAMLALAVFLALAARPTPATAGAITIGPGPAIGTDRAGVTWYQEFQDWTRADCKALDPNGAADMYRYNDGFDDSRDLVAFYEREENNKVYFRVDLYDLALGAETNNLNLYLAIDAAAGGQVFLPDFVNAQTDHPWEVCVCLYNAGTTYGTDYRIYDASFNNITSGYLGAYFNSQLDAVEFGIDRAVLTSHGWNGSTPLQFQVFTTKDNAPASSCPSGSKIADAIPDADRACLGASGAGVLHGAVSSAAQAGVVYFASIAHGNQSVNRANDIGSHIYDSQGNTGITGGTGFLRTLDTHEIFGVPLNIHPSGTLTIAAKWAARPGGASDPQDGPSFLARVAQFVDNDQSVRPGSLIGGVLSEHIMPYFEGPVNQASLAFTDSLNQVAYGVSAASAKVMHVPERVIRSQSTSLSPLTGLTFTDIAGSAYQATVLDEVTHLHAWFYPNEDCSSDAGYRHKLHKVNGVYCFMINDREDQQKFGNWDGGMMLDARSSLLQKALYGNSSEMVVIFDDWEALAGKSFDPSSGNPVPNNNPNQYHNTIRWAANHPWIQVSNLKDLLALAIANPGAFVIDHGTRTDLPVQTYEYLKHSSEDSYNNWYYDNDHNTAGNEQDFYHLIPVITGPQGDYHARNASPSNDGPALPSGKTMGDMNTPNTLLHDAWADITGAPASRLRDLGKQSFLALIYETAWHEEDNQDYSNNCFDPWLNPDLSWDGVNTWNLRLLNHVRQVGMYAAAARWAQNVRTHAQGAATITQAVDIDQDGENEYVIQNDHLFAVFERYGGRCVLACEYDAAQGDAQVIVGAPYTNPSSPGEEEITGSQSNRCSAFKDMNDGTYADAPYSALAVSGGWKFTSPDGKIAKTITAAAGTGVLSAAYHQTLGLPLFVRVGLSPNPLDLALHGQDHLTSTLDGAHSTYTLANSAGGVATLAFAGMNFNASPADGGWNRRNVALTETVELSGGQDFTLALQMAPATTGVGDPAPARPAAFAVHGPWPSPARGTAHMSVALPRALNMRWDAVDAAGRRVAGADLGIREAGLLDIPIGDEHMKPGLYFVRVQAGEHVVTQRWAVVR